MGIIDRILLALYTFVLSILSIGVMVLCSQFVPFDFVWTNLTYLSNQWETVIGGAVFLIISLRLLKVSLSSRPRPHQDKEAVVVHGKAGDVHVAVSAIKNLTDKTTRLIKGVRDVKIEVFAERPKKSSVEDAVVKVKIKLVIGQEDNVIMVSDQVQDAVKDQLTTIVGLSTAEIDVLIEDISNASVQKQRVV